jgi:hypothetical protein
MLIRFHVAEFEEETGIISRYFIKEVKGDL